MVAVVGRSALCSNNEWATRPSSLPDFPAERRQLDCAVVPGWKWNALLAVLDPPHPPPPLPYRANLI